MTVRLPLAPGAYMSSSDRGVWLLENGYWRMPGGVLVRQSAMLSGAMLKVVEPHLPFRRMVPVKRRE